MAVARLRASAWQSVFTKDMHRYLRFMYERMADFTTLIVGASGTGKELVARAIGLSRYIPFSAALKRLIQRMGHERLRILSPTDLHGVGYVYNAEDPETWEKVVRKLGAGMMPPAVKPRPDSHQQAQFLAYLETELDALASYADTTVPVPAKA